MTPPCFSLRVTCNCYACFVHYPFYFSLKLLLYCKYILTNSQTLTDSNFHLCHVVLGFAFAHEAVIVQNKALSRDTVSYTVRQYHRIKNYSTSAR